jgi:hypothetical protein
VSYFSSPKDVLIIARRGFEWFFWLYAEKQRWHKVPDEEYPRFHLISLLRSQLPHQGEALRVLNEIHFGKRTILFLL